MEKDYRLFVKNLPLNIDDNGLRKIFGQLVTIKKIDLKEKKDLDNKINKFAFVNVTTTDRGLRDCFGALNGERFDGFEISVEVAKESFLDRLKREREENQQKKESPKEYAKPFVFENTISTSSAKSKHKKFDDEDFSSKEFEVEKVKKKRKSSVDHTVELESEPVQSFQVVQNEAKDFEEPHDSFKIEKNKYVNNVDEGDAEISNINRIKKQKRAKEFNNNKPTRSSIPEKPVSKSEMKRLMSLKEKKKVFKAQERVIRNALKSVDDKKLNKKIVFDDDMDIESPTGVTQKNSKQKNALFESDDEQQEEFEWNEEELEAKANTKSKLMKMQTNIGNDKRFVLDKRFIEEEEETAKETNSTKPNDDDPTFDEKKWQLDILEKVLGKPIHTPTATNNDAVQKKKKMIRYDPTANDHEKYEVTVEKPKEEKSKKKKKKNVVEEVQEEAPLPTSKDIYFDVSENLADSFKPDQGFSLLKTLGRDTVTEKRETAPAKEAEESERSGGFKFGFTSKNPFKYDSSDDEGGYDRDEEDYSFKMDASRTKTSEDDDKLFTTLGDSRIEELNKFFNTPATVDEEAFKRRRRELKKIVRTKIRNNLKKAIPWNKKKVWKQKKKQR